MRRIFMLFLPLLLPLVSVAQLPERDIILGVSFVEESERLSAELILTILKELKQANVPNKKIASAVIDLNTSNLTLKQETNIIQSLEDRAKGYPRYKISEAAIEKNEQLIQSTLELDLLLAVNIVETKSGVLEYQFQLYNVEAGSTPQGDKPGILPFIDFANPKAVSSVIINDLATRERMLKNAIQKLFPSSNFPPIPKITLNDLANKPQKTHYFAKGDSFQIDGSNSIDDDTPRELWKFHWRQINEDGKPNAPKKYMLPLKKQEASQWLSPPEIGKYAIGLRIFDGSVLSPTEDTLQVQVIQQPQIALSRKEFRSKSKITLFDWLFKKKYRQNKFSTQFQGTWGNSDFPISDMNLRLLKKQSFQRGQAIQTNLKRLNEKTFEFQLSGKLKDEDYFEYLVDGNFEGVAAIPSSFILQQPEKEFLKLDIGFDAFIGKDILRPQTDSFKIRRPIAAKGGIFLGHWANNTSLSLEVGVLIPFNFNSFDYGIGQATLKAKTAWYINTKEGPKPVDIYLALHGTTVNFDINDQFQQRRFWGLGFGYNIQQWDLEIDIINFHYDFENKRFVYSWGFRKNFVPFFDKTAAAPLVNY